MTLSLRSLRVFVAVTEELHFGAAAALQHMTQPPLSQQVRQLEASLGGNRAFFSNDPLRSIDSCRKGIAVSGRATVG